MIRTPTARRSDGFTLVEMLVVMAILGILAGLLIPAAGRSVETSRATACVSHLRQLGIALQAYLGDSGDRLPIMHDRRASADPATEARQEDTVDQVLKPWMGSTAILRCPSDRVGLHERTGSSYTWNSLLNGQHAARPEVFGIALAPGRIPVFFDKEAFHKARGPGRGVNYLFADGHLHHLLVSDGGPRSP